MLVLVETYPTREDIEQEGNEWLRLSRPATPDEEAYHDYPGASVKIVEYFPVGRCQRLLPWNRSLGLDEEYGDMIAEATDAKTKISLMLHHLAAQTDETMAIVAFGEAKEKATFCVDPETQDVVVSQTGPVFTCPPDAYFCEATAL